MLSPADEQPRPVPGSDGKLLRTRHLEQTKKQVKPLWDTAERQAPEIRPKQ